MGDFVLEWKHNMLRKLFLLTLILLAGSVPPAAAQDDASWLVQQVNALRANVGVPGLSLNGQLSAAAVQHSTYMATTCDVSHTESSGSSPADRARANGYTGSRVGENIYGGSVAQASNAWNFWLNSGIHYQGMTSAMYNEVGIGIAPGPCGNYYTMVFGYRSDGSAPIVVATVDSGGGQSAAPAAGNAAVISAPVVQAPTQAPYVPPSTPTATIDTLTPSPTWTLTPTYTPSPTGTVDIPTATPLVLPTVPAEVAFVPSETATLADTSTPTLTPSPSQTPTPVPAMQPQKSESQSGMQPRDFIPFAVVGQFVLIGIAGFFYFRRSK